ncbi:hypothetical protein PHMEG_0004212 [Phytophthora megakarya]|uniref:Uncharacterized protein n=1 Tax=Phytophthora megakarya TaxID=4795 RepID=A0A225WUF9_9STRA|nr:hypothetical protein PHMEG_0004212 [Phytophthora megakarya]
MTPSARNVCDHFSSPYQGDFLMHLLSLCLLYSLDLKRTKRKQDLFQLKDLYNLPAVNIEIDAKTRVGYAVTLLRRSIYNHYAFTKYFETAPPSEQSVWNCISALEWKLVTEMEGITNQLAQFSLGEVQKDGVASSYALLCRRLLTTTVESTSFDCLYLRGVVLNATDFRSDVSISM